MKKIVICGGHLTPALALCDELKKERNIKIYFLGRKYSTEGSKNLSAEYNTIKNLNVKFYPIITGRFQRRFTRYTIPSLLKIPIGFIQSIIYLIKIRPHLIISFGGYISFPVVFAGWLLGIRSITHEQSVLLGLANKLNALFVEKVYLAWHETTKFITGSKYQIIGNLARESIFEKETTNVKIQNFLKGANRLILVTGGNQGSHFLNWIILKILPSLSKFHILHQVGTANYKQDLDRAMIISHKNYLAVDYIGPADIGAVLNRANLIISRSGANIVWDLAVLAKVAILIPLPISASAEQTANAKILEKAGSAIILYQKDLNVKILMHKIDYIFNNIVKFQKNAQTFSKTLPKTANQILASEILKMLNI